MFYLKNLYSGLNEGVMSIWDSKTKRTTWVRVDNIEHASKLMEAMSVDVNVYFGWGIQRTPAVRGRGNADGVAAIPGFMLDIDLKSDVRGIHSQNELLPTTIEEALGIISKAGLPMPSGIRNSGNGAYFDYLFEQPWVFADDSECATGRKLSTDFQRVFIAAFKAQGFHLDSVGDLARVTRMPGTLNHKTTPPKPVTLVEFNEDRRYKQVDLAKLVEDRAPRKNTLSPTTRSSLQSLAGAEVPGERQLPNFESVAAGCGWVGACIENRAQISEPHWFALASVMERCQSGPELFHQFSSEYPGYSVEETNGKLGRSEGPRTCTNICHTEGFEGCRQCAFFGGGVVNTPLQLGFVNPNLAKLMASNVFDAQTSRYFETATRTPLSDRSFSALHRHLTKGTTPTNATLAHRFTRKVYRTDYLPGLEDLVFKDAKGHSVLNLWQSSGVNPGKGDAAIIREHIAYIIPDETERGHFLNALAHLVQKPQVKIRHILLVIGRQGTGKSFIGNVMTKIFGEQNVYVAEGSDLESDFTAPMGNRQMLLMEEFRVSKKLDSYEALKLWAADEFVTVNEKHVPRYQARTPRGILSFTNHSYPINLPADDRRFWIVRSPAIPQSPDYYSRLFTAGIEQVPAFYGWLLERNISEFNPSAPPPSTSVKKSIVERSDSAVVQEIKHMMESGSFPFMSEVFLLDDLRGELSKRPGVRSFTLGEVIDALRKTGAICLTRQIRIGGGVKVRPWAWRRAHQWLDADIEEIRHALSPMAMAVGID